MSEQLSGDWFGEFERAPESIARHTIQILFDLWSDCRECVRFCCEVRSHKRAAEFRRAMQQAHGISPKVY